LSAFDVDGGYVVSPRPEGVQISSGTELTALQSKPSFHLFAKAQARVEQALELGAPTMEEVAVGNRPTLPDSLPVIGPATGGRGLWLAADHQHVGLNTATGTADLLASLINGSTLPIDPKLFSYERFSKR